MVKCFYCGQTFDASVEPFIKPNSRRYAHKECAESADGHKTKEQKDKETLEDYINELFGTKSISPKVKKQIEDYKVNKNFTYSGMHKTLKYWFEIRKEPLEKANGGIGIVPYIYDEAFQYWRALWEARERNKEVKISNYVLPVKEVHISSPQREPMKHIRKLFTFLDEEG